MTNSVRTQADLLDNLFQDGQAPGSITAQDVRDLIVSLTSFTFDNVVLNTSADNPSYQEGLVFYDKTHKALTYYNNDSGTYVITGRQLLVRAASGSPSTALVKGDLVYAVGADPNDTEVSLVKKVVASTATPNVLGFVTADIAIGSHGYVTTFGLLHEIDTTAYTAGAPVFLSAGSPGDFTATAPTLPKETVHVGTIVNSDTNGHILVHILPLNKSFETTANAAFRSAVTQTAASTNTTYPVSLEIESVKTNVNHVGSPASVVEIAVDGTYVVSTKVQLNQTGGGGGAVINVWLQEDTGSGWQNAPSASRIEMSANAPEPIMVIRTASYAAGDKIRLVWSTNNTNGQITAYAASGNLPAIPSATFTIFKLASEATM